MKLNEYLHSASLPPVYTPGTATMWDDEHISKQLLAVHLNPDIDLASRKPATILSTIEWLEQAVPGPGAAILDMGCGPGLYAEHLAKRGYHVTGMDISANSIRHARGAAQKSGLDITYRNQDYRAMGDTEAFDLILMIFTDFGVLVPEDREKVLSNVYRALKPGGVFCFDFLNDSYPLDDVGCREWEICPSGFWKEGPYLVLQEKHYYREEHVCLSQYIVTGDDAETSIYRFWTHAFSHDQVRELLDVQGFAGCGFYRDIIPGCAFYSSENISFCLASKDGRSLAASG